MLVTELPGHLRVVEKGNAAPPVADTPGVRVDGQGGLLSVALHPGYPTNGWIYLSFSDRSADGNGLTAVVRGRLKENSWTDQETIFRAPEKFYRGGGIHFGSRFAFDDVGHLFFTMGERGQKQDAQDITRPNGKVHRVFDDGRIPPDNPFVNTSNAIPSIWSFGHRNPQGLTRHPVTGEIWEAEHGPRGGDEVNWIRPGLNYGWPLICWGMDYDGSPISAFTAKEGLEQPVTYWTPSLAVGAISFYSGDKFPRWKNNLFVTSLAAQELRRLVTDGHKVVSQEILFKNIGRLRDAANGPDGLLYLALNDPGKIIRLEPVVQ
jgi:glucose/arabinose dehydrogenase